MKFYGNLSTEEKKGIDINAMKAEVDKMTHVEMCSLWRFHTSDSYSPYFDSTHPICGYFKDRLFKHFGGFTPEISKQIGWQ